MMTTSTEGRRREAARVIGAVTEWANREPDIRAVALVGSNARGTEQLESDVDFILLCDDPDVAAGSMWFSRFQPRARLVRTTTARSRPLPTRHVRTRRARRAVSPDPESLRSRSSPRSRLEFIRMSTGAPNLLSVVAAVWGRRSRRIRCPFALARRS
ncbi:nucleotidyltransferase domain-containing protein [Leifsonia sp. LS-T14]|uniref:nucleotidyltransferase domain-containing protein n=1 Tax=unclassified Leifsonia TaxID=2663824 RepID=UPI0035A66B83